MCFKGFKAHLGKWKARGFDNDVKRPVSLLEAGSIAQAEQVVCLIRILSLREPLWEKGGIISYFIVSRDIFGLI